MEHKRVTLLCGHYGSGKTNIAVNMALDMKKKYNNVAIADLDIVNPYFRTKDSQKELEEAGIRFIGSKYANSNLDIPALPSELYAITADKSCMTIVDVGGDDRGAVALGRFRPALLEEDNYDFLAVINKYRPLTSDVSSTIEIMHEIEAACRLKFTAVINNSNIGCETTGEDVLNTIAYGEEVAARFGIPVCMTTVDESLYEELKDKIPNLFPLHLQSKIW